MREEFLSKRFYVFVLVVFTRAKKTKIRSQRIFNQVCMYATCSSLYQN